MKISRASRISRLVMVTAVGFVCSSRAVTSMEWMPINEASAKAVQTNPVSIAAVIRHLEKTPVGESLALARVAQAIGVESVSLRAGSSEEDTLKNFNSESVPDAIRVHIRNLQSWNSPVPRASLKEVKAQRLSLEQALGAKSNEWAWFLSQWGEREAAKKLLQTRYENGYELVMKLKTATSEFGRGPLSEVEADLRALDSLSGARETAVFHEKMRKMKVHVSRLPQAHIVT